MGARFSELGTRCVPGFFNELLLICTREVHRQPSMCRFYAYVHPNGTQNKTLRIDTSGWALCKKNGDISGSDQGILLTQISNESLCFPLSYDISHI